MIVVKKRSYPMGGPHHSGGIRKRANSRPDRRPTSAPVALTGLERVLPLENHYVQATQATFDSETSPSEPRNLREIFARRKEIAKTISGDLSRLEKRRPHGMVNLTGALCYRHSLFQAILHMPHFVNWLLEYHQPQDCVSGHGELCICCSLRHIAAVYWGNGGASSSTLSDLLSRANKIFAHRGWSTHNSSGHGDPDDQLGWILNEIRVEVPKSVYARFDAFSNLTLSSSITCKKCKHSSTTEGNEERHISLPIKPELANSVVDSYLARFMIEVIEDYRCGNPECKDTSRKTRVQKIAYAPEVLVIQLKRFDWEGRKVNTFVRVDESLDLNKYRLNPDVGNLEYRLTAVVEHTGNLSFGHYHCLARHSDNRWYDFNDESVSGVRLENALPERRKGGGWTPYLLFYQRQH